MHVPAHIWQPLGAILLAAVALLAMVKFGVRKDD